MTLIRSSFLKMKIEIVHNKINNMPLKKKKNCVKFNFMMTLKPIYVHSIILYDIYLCKEHVLELNAKDTTEKLYKCAAQNAWVCLETQQNPEKTLIAYK